MPFNKVLVANRGEIAVRIIRALREMGIRSVAVYSDVDRASLHVQMADEAAHIGPAPSTESYLSIPAILSAAARHEVDAIHPGYGFLSENAEFARACETAGITFIGPSSRSIAAMGSKTGARRIAQDAGVPVLPGVHEQLEFGPRASELADAIGYPILIKADAGGGGKGMRLVAEPSGLAAALRDASSEASNAFRNGQVYIEKYLERPRHIEIQVLGDRHGHLIHLGERECSLQRRHQKVIEEAPSPLVERVPGLRERMGDAAVRLAKAAGYTNAGTLEFLVTQQGDFYFLEMNTRLQVEHPVTEMVTGVDIVQWQVRIAAGEPLSIRQDDIRFRGAALECRIYAEDARNNFLPSSGTIHRLEWPAGPGVRLDAGIYEGWGVPIEYDPLLAKLAVWAENRPLTIQRAVRAIGECYISGIETSLEFFSAILQDPGFIEGALHTGFIDEYLARAHRPAAPPDTMFAAVVAAALTQMDDQRTTATRADSKWLSAGRFRSLRGS